MSQPTPQAEFTDACRRLLASTAIESSEGMNIEKRIMIHHGIAELFPVGSPEREESRRAASALSEAEKCQLQLTRLLNGSN